LTKRVFLNLNLTTLIMRWTTLWKRFGEFVERLSTEDNEDMDLD